MDMWMEDVRRRLSRHNQILFCGHICRRKTARSRRWRFAGAGRPAK